MQDGEDQRPNGHTIDSDHDDCVDDSGDDEIDTNENNTNSKSDVEEPEDDSSDKHGRFQACTPSDQLEQKKTSKKKTTTGSNESKASERKATERKATERKATERKATERKATERKATERKATDMKTADNLGVTEINMEDVQLKPVGLTLSDLGMHLYLKVDEKLISAATASQQAKSNVSKKPTERKTTSRKNKAMLSDNQSRQVKSNNNGLVCNRLMEVVGEGCNYMDGQYSSANSRSAFGESLPHAASMNDERFWSCVEPDNNTKSQLTGDRLRAVDRILTRDIGSKSNAASQRNERDEPLNQRMRDTDVEPDFDVRGYLEWLAKRRKITKPNLERNRETLTSGTTVNYKDYIQDEFDYSRQTKDQNNGRSMVSGTSVYDNRRNSTVVKDVNNGKTLASTKDRKNGLYCGQSSKHYDERHLSRGGDQSYVRNKDKCGGNISGSSKTGTKEIETRNRPDELDKELDPAGANCGPSCIYRQQMPNCSCTYRQQMPNCSCTYCQQMPNCSCTYCSKSLLDGGNTSRKRCNTFIPIQQPEEKMKRTNSCASNYVDFCQRVPRTSSQDSDTLAFNKKSQKLVDKVSHKPEPPCGRLPKSSHCDAVYSDVERREHTEQTGYQLESDSMVCCRNVNCNMNDCMTYRVNRHANDGKIKTSTVHRHAKDGLASTDNHHAKDVLPCTVHGHAKVRLPCTAKRHATDTDLCMACYEDKGENGYNVCSGQQNTMDNSGVLVGEPHQCQSSFNFDDLPEDSMEGDALAKLNECAHNLNKDFKANYAKMKDAVKQINGQYQMGKGQRLSEADGQNLKGQRVSEVDGKHQKGKGQKLFEVDGQHKKGKGQRGSEVDINTEDDIAKNKQCSLM